jgi:hypothetical protein
MVRSDSAHLLGYVLLGTVARFQRDSAALPAIYAAFNRRYEQEMARGRPEYQEHRMSIGDFRRSAAGAPTDRPGGRSGRT